MQGIPVKLNPIVAESRGLPCFNRKGGETQGNGKGKRNIWLERKAGLPVNIRDEDGFQNGSDAYIVYRKYTI
jgi:hypothetical protein